MFKSRHENHNVRFLKRWVTTGGVFETLQSNLTFNPVCSACVTLKRLVHTSQVYETLEDFCLMPKGTLCIRMRHKGKYKQIFWSVHLVNVIIFALLVVMFCSSSLPEKNICPSCCLIIYYIRQLVANVVQTHYKSGLALLSRQKQHMVIAISGFVTMCDYLGTARWCSG